MEQNDIQIAACIQIARQQRSRALGDLIAKDWKELLHRIARPLRRDGPCNAKLTSPSDFIRYQCLP